MFSSKHFFHDSFKVFFLSFFFILNKFFSHRSLIIKNVGIFINQLSYIPINVDIFVLLKVFFLVCMPFLAWWVLSLIFKVSFDRECWRLWFFRLFAFRFLFIFLFFFILSSQRIFQASTGFCFLLWLFNKSSSQFLVLYFLVFNQLLDCHLLVKRRLWLVWTQLLGLILGFKKLIRLCKCLFHRLFQRLLMFLIVWNLIQIGIKVTRRIHIR